MDTLQNLPRSVLLQIIANASYGTINTIKMIPKTFLDLVRDKTLDRIMFRTRDGDTITNGEVALKDVNVHPVFQFISRSAAKKENIIVNKFDDSCDVVQKFPVMEVAALHELAVIPPVDTLRLYMLPNQIFGCRCHVVKRKKGVRVLDVISMMCQFEAKTLKEEHAATAEEYEEMLEDWRFFDTEFEGWSAFLDCSRLALSSNFTR